VTPIHRAKHSALDNKGVSPLESLVFLVHAWIGTYLVAYLSDSLTESVTMPMTAISDTARDGPNEIGVSRTDVNVVCPRKSFAAVSVGSFILLVSPEHS